MASLGSTMAGRAPAAILAMAAIVAIGQAEPNREGRFLSTHLDLLSAASELFPSAFSQIASEALEASSSERQVSVVDPSGEEVEEVLLAQQDEQNGFGEKLNAEARVEVDEAEEAIADLVDAMEAFGGEPPELLEEVFEPEVVAYQESAPVRGRYNGYRRRPEPQPEPEPEPFVIICKDPAYCPPPTYPSPYGHRPSYGSGLTICRDPNNCPVPGYGPPAPRPYRIRPRPSSQDHGDAPRYTSENTETTPRPLKKYGYHPIKSNPTIYRQEVMGMKEKEPMMDIDEVEEVDIENMSMEELREFIAAAEAEQEEPTPTSFEKLTVAPSMETEAKMKMVEQVLSNMNVAELVDFVKASSVLDAGVPVLEEAQVERMTEPELKQVLMEAEELPKVMKQVDEIDIRQMTKETLKEVVEDIMEDHEEDLEEMTKVELKEIVMEAVAMSPAEKPKVLQHVDEDDVGKMTKETLQKVAEEVIENKLEAIEEMTKQELKEIVMEVAVEKEELIIVPVAEEDIEQMNLKELKEFVKVASDLAAVEKPQPEVTEEDVAKMSMEELKEFIKEAEVEENLLSTSPISEIDIQAMSEDQLKDFVMEAVIETKLLEPIVIPIREAQLVQMSKEGLKELIMETPELIEKVIATEEASTPGENGKNKKVTMEKMIEMQKKRKEEKPVAMLIKGGMLFKDGKTTEEKKADDMGMTVKEMITMTEGLTRNEVRQIDSGITVEEMIAIENDVSVEEMIAMKNDITVEEVAEIKETMTMEEILEEKPEISVAEVIAIKKEMSVEEMVAMKNDVPVLEILEIKDKLSMNEIMSLQDGITKEDVMALTSEDMTVAEVIEEKEGSIQLGTPEPFAVEPVSTQGHASMNGQSEVFNINEETNQGIQFAEVTTNGPTTKVPEILEPIRNTNFPPRDILRIEEMNRNRMRTKMRGEAKKSQTRQRPEQGRPQGGLKMRPMRVKVRKPVKPTKPPVVESHLSFGEMESLMEQAFGLKDFPMMRPGEFIQMDDGVAEEVVTNEDLVLEPPPAVPGRPVTEPKIVFNEFLDETTPVPNLINVDNVKTVDLAGFDQEEDDFPIYDTEIVSLPTPPPVSVLKNSEFPDLKNSDFPDMPIFSNFPMMGPGEFIQMEDDSEGSDDPSDYVVGFGGQEEQVININKANDADGFSTFAEIKTPDMFESKRPVETSNSNSAFNVFSEMKTSDLFESNRPTAVEETNSAFTAFSDMMGPAGMDLFKSTKNNNNPDTLLGLVTKEVGVKEEVRPFRSPRPRPTSHPNHRYPLFRGSPTPFTARPAINLEGGSYMKSSFRQRLRPARQPAPYNGFEDRDTFGNDDEEDDDAPHFREIPEKESFDYEEIKPFVAFGKEDAEGGDLGESSMKGVNFYQQYGQHDDRPTLSRLAPSKKDMGEEDEEEEQRRRPGEIRFGGMSFALPPPGAFPDRPEDIEEKKVSEIYPGHPASQVFPNRPVSEVFRDIPEQKLAPEIPPSFPPSQGIRIEETPATADVKVPSFENFFSDDSIGSYLRNPFGEDFIKLEIDQSNFRTNKTKPSVHHIPLDVHGFPDVPSLRSQPEPSEGDRKKRKPLFSKPKPPYKPPPVITEYQPPGDYDSPAESKVLDYKHQFPASKAEASGTHIQEFSKQPPTWRGGLFQEAMSNLPNAIRDLPAFMERLMGNHAGWVRRAWQGERDESAAA